MQRTPLTTLSPQVTESAPASSGAPEKAAPARHLAYLDGLRAVAALYVVVSHALSYVVGATHPDPKTSLMAAKLMAYTRLLLGQGHYAVTVFIILSGFCLMLPVTRYGELRGGAIFFFKKRARRILPPYYAAVAFSLFLTYTVIGRKTGTHWDTTIPVTSADLLTHLFLLQDLFVATTDKINHALWSISVEWRIYFLFPIFLLWWKKWRPAAIVAGLLVASYLVQICLPFTPLNHARSGVCAHYVGIFSVGMLACEVAFSKNPAFGFRDRIAWEKLSFFSFVVGILLLFLVRSLPYYLNDLVVALWAFSLLVALSRSTNGISLRFLSWKPVVFIGTFAYSIYLIHAPILQLMSQFLLGPLRMSWVPNVFLTLGLGVVLSLLAAYCFFLCCERPFLNTKVKTPS